MNILASVIPGVRDVRSPLIAGYMWLLFFWLFVDPKLPLEQNPGVVGSVATLGNQIGSVASAIAVSVGAYLVGAISLGLASNRIEEGSRRAVNRLDQVATRSTSNRVVRWSTRPLRAFHGWADESYYPAPLGWDEEMEHWAKIDRILNDPSGAVPWQPRETVDKLIPAMAREELEWLPRVRWVWDQARRELSAASASIPGSALGPSFEKLRSIESKLTPPQLLDAVKLSQQSVARVQRELGRSATLILGDQKAQQIFGEVDRVRSEGELRLAVVPPLAALAILLSFTDGWWWSLMLVGAAVLFAQGMTLENRARRLVASAIAYRPDVPSPTRDDFADRVRALEAQNEEPQGEDFGAVYARATDQLAQLGALDDRQRPGEDPDGK